MGLFSKLRANMNHGGVTVHVQAPDTVPSNQVIPVQVTLTADSPQTVAGVKVELKARMKEQGMTLGRGAGVQQNATTEQTVAVAESHEPLSLSPGQPQTVSLQLFMSGNTSAMGVLGGLGNTGGALGGVLQSAMAATQAFNHLDFIYTVHAHADVEGIALDPSDKRSIQLLPPAAAAQPATTGPVQPTPIADQPIQSQAPQQPDPPQQ
ncbi:MAG: hypothetical protein WDN27_00975 [Candidatus Saccharibacteria bacterium]